MFYMNVNQNWFANCLLQTKYPISMPESTSKTNVKLEKLMKSWEKLLKSSSLSRWIQVSWPSHSRKMMLSTSVLTNYCPWQDSQILRKKVEPAEEDGVMVEDGMLFVHVPVTFGCHDVV